MPFKSYKDESRANYGQDVRDGQSMPWDCLQIGCLMRIADAVEKMAANHDQLIRERDRYKGWLQGADNDRRRLERSNAALRGVITKLKERTERDDQERTKTRNIGAIV